MRLIVALFLSLFLLSCAPESTDLPPDNDNNSSSNSSDNRQNNDTGNNSNNSNNSSNNNNNNNNNNSNNNNNNNNNNNDNVPDKLPNGTCIYTATVGGAKTPSIVLFDFSDRNSRKVIWSFSDKLEDDPEPVAAISEDRSAIVVATNAYRTASDLKNKNNRSLWLIKLYKNGRHQKTRLTPTFPPPPDSSSDLSISVRGPLFSPDGRGVWFLLSQFWSEGLEMKGGTSAAYMSFRGKFDIKTPIKPCSITKRVVPHPSKPFIATAHTVCASGSEGIYIYDGNFVRAKYANLPDYLSLSSFPSFQWYGDQLLFLASTEWVTRDGDRFSAKGIFSLSTRTGKVVDIFPPLNRDTDYLSFAVHRQLGQILISVYSNSDKSATLYTGDLKKLDKLLYRQNSAFDARNPNCGQ